MLHKDIIKGLAHLKASIEERAIDEVLEDSVQRRRERSRGSALISYRGWVLTSEKFSDAAHAIMEVFSLNSLKEDESPFWKIILTETVEHPLIMEVRKNSQQLKGCRSEAVGRLKSTRQLEF